MALSPLRPQEARAVEIEPTPQPSRTYEYNFETGEFGGMIDGEAALRQAIRKAIVTARFRYLIYGHEHLYGCDLEDLIGQDLPIELLNAEIPRVISEALLIDDRIADVYNFTITREGDGLYVSFFVDTTEGTIREEVTI
ncbi:Phage-like element PBSX protein, XkdS [Brevibacillus borstelensis AK1]|uniref:Phage-like element PBSX protein, XkdS n=1 Tax=Brevibacillus borstelensis AK1 TaxID=1300222 RepID=M8E628_9BACL|nr:DUF2634 domain-containing protein [Brevibacillus borstelensis]EMT54706.1 Phage-like element PBSX protein, XkdS [Brevibacillus borstelensis AK1]